LVRALTGVDTDRLPQEKARGISIELGFAFRAVGDQGVIGFIDVPGHERLVHTMVGGVSGIRHALLVVAADDGPMPQTFEHLAILDLLGLASATLVITKTDRADAARVSQVEAEMQALLAASRIGLAPAFHVCALTGEDIDNLWGHLAALSTAFRTDGPGHASGFRMSIDRCFTMAGVGCIVTGTVHAGTVRVGERLAIVPGSHEVRVRGMRVQGVDALEATVGVRCALNIGGPHLDISRIARGDWVVTPDIAVDTERIDARLRLLKGHQPLRSGARVHVHLAAKACTGRVVVLQEPQGGPVQPARLQRRRCRVPRAVGARRADRCPLG
jgi:selenocysteine-specific elongation factor